MRRLRNGRVTGQDRRLVEVVADGTTEVTVVVRRR